MFCSLQGSYRCLSWQILHSHNRKLSFYLSCVSILSLIKCVNTINDCLCYNASKNNIKLKKDNAEKFSMTTGIEIQSQHWYGNRQL